MKYLRIFVTILFVVGLFSIWTLSQPGNSNRFVEPSNRHKNTYDPRNEFGLDLRLVEMATEKRDAQALLLLGDSFEKKWAHDVLLLSRLLAEISNSFASYEFPDIHQYSYSVAFAKKVLRNADEIPLQMEYEMVSKLQSTSTHLTAAESKDNWAQDRASRVNLIFHLWNRLDKNIDRKFNVSDSKNQPMLNVRVPGPYPSGVRPEEIHEPDIRAKYIAAVAANQAKAEKYNLQVQLQKLDRVLPEFVERVLIEFYSVQPSNTKELEAKIRLFGLSRATRDRIVRAVENNLKE